MIYKMKRISGLTIGLMFWALPSLLGVAQDPNYCSRLLHDQMLRRPSTAEGTEVEGAKARALPISRAVFLADEARLNGLNVSSEYRKVARITVRPSSIDGGLYTLQMGAGSPLYVGTNLGDLTKSMNSASRTLPGETVYVEIVGAPERLDGLRHSLIMQQSIQRDGVQVIPLTSAVVDNETQHLFFKYPVNEVVTGQITRVTLGSEAGLFQRTLEFVVRTAQGTRRVTLKIFSRSSEVLSQMADAVMRVFQADTVQVKTITEIVSAAKVKVRKSHGHVAEVDYIIQAEVGQTFMVAIPMTVPVKG